MGRDGKMLAVVELFAGMFAGMVAGMVAGMFVGMAAGICRTDTVPPWPTALSLSAHPSRVRLASQSAL